MKPKVKSGLKIIALNRKASFNYFFNELLEAGIVLRGSEIKSVRSGKVNIAESYAIEKDSEIFLINSHIPLYRQSSYNNHNPKSDRKLLLNRNEINKLIGRINQEGLTLIPTNEPTHARMHAPAGLKKQRSLFNFLWDTALLSPRNSHRFSPIHG